MRFEAERKDYQYLEGVLDRNLGFAGRPKSIRSDSCEGLTRMDSIRPFHPGQTRGHSCLQEPVRCVYKLETTLT